MFEHDYEIELRLMKASLVQWRATKWYLCDEMDPVRWQEQLCKLYGDREVMRDWELLQAWVGKSEGDSRYSDAYSRYQLEWVADRLGALISWARHEKVVTHTANGLQLLDRGPTFMNVGAAQKQYPIRIKDIPESSVEGVKKLVARELKRRERAHWKAIEKLQATAAAAIDQIAEQDVMYPLTGPLEIFEVGDVSTIVGARLVIIDYIATLDAREAGQMVEALAQASRNARMYRNKHTNAVTIPTDDVDVLSSFG